jgi:hypothetical protein
MRRFRVLFLFLLGLLLIPMSASGAFSATTFLVPAGVHTLLMTGLTPSASYGVTLQSGGGTLITIAPGQTGAKADAAGLLRVTF